ncbi:hypothetical protein ABH930_000297 [Kitasatospora sp. GAS204A]|uniref:DUF6011 domain-containing protein n=1 Tax=unclassified Kitasatospora TaxID=2633591 RepID=UPI0024741D99|nr:DUF6011 domain-containing protein [Kitasatospora sp. GAS204B]MDH6116878.1 hypothetical protein [Kitasatospora sp. GAS204B]
MAASTHTHCLRCGRTLKSATSQARGRGRHCAAKVRRAAVVVDLSAYKPAQIASAQELIEDAAIIPIRGNRIYRSVSSDGSELYLTAVTGHCNCPAGLRGTRCYHVAAAQLLAAA